MMGEDRFRGTQVADNSAARSYRITGSMRGKWRRNLFLVLLVADTVIICGTLLTAYFVRFALGRDVLDSAHDRTMYMVMMPLLAMGWVVGLFWSQTYRIDNLAIGTDEYRGVIRATFSMFGILAIASELFKLDVARGYLAIAFPMGLALLLLERVCVRMWLLHMRKQRALVDGVLIVGSPQEVRYVAEGISRNPQAGLVVRAVATDTPGSETFELSDGEVVPQAGMIDSVVAAVPKYRANTVIVAGNNRMSRTQLRDLGWALEGTDIRLALATRLTDVAGPRIHWRPIEGLPLMSVEMPRYSGMKYTLKRVFDIVVSASMLIILSPVLIGLAIAVRLDSPGPIFFRQTRVGINGSHFKMTKFRSMVVDAEDRLADLQTTNEGSGVLFKMKDDPRITKVGKFIRRYSLDELPQLFDVLTGGMSLVGPRPPLPSEVDEYEHHVHRRLNVKPGITGPWQVGGRSNLSWEESVRKDLYYVENWSLSGDLVIMFKTVRAVFARDGAY